MIAFIGCLFIPVPVYSETIPVPDGFLPELIKSLIFLQGSGKLENFTFTYSGVSYPSPSDAIVKEIMNTFTISCNSLIAESNLRKEGNLTVVDYSLDVHDLKIKMTGQTNFDMDLSTYSFSTTIKIRLDENGITISAYAPAWRLMLSRLG